MSERLEKIESKIDKLDSRLDSIDKTLTKQEANIEHHVRRCDELEENNQLMRIELDKKLETIRMEMKPVEQHVYYMHGALKALGVLSVIVGLIAAIKSLF